jgi:S1-C subfamily serine protease
MSLLDAVLLVLFVLTVFYGRKRAPLKQLVSIIGLISGLILAVLAYKQLSFITEQSGMRVLILVLLVFGIGFLTYDICLHVGAAVFSKGEAFSKAKKRQQLPMASQVASVVVGVAGVTILAWLMTAILNGSQIPFVRQQVDRSFVVSTLDSIAQPPAPFREVAHLLGPFSAPRVFVGQEPEFDKNVASAQNSASLDAATQQAKASVVKVIAWGCGSTSVGSGSVVSGSLVVTNAHVVAGADRISFQAQNGAYTLSPVFFDPKLDIAVLRSASGLTEKPLQFNTSEASNGTVASIIGYPGGGDLVSSSAVVVSTMKARGYDIYGSSEVTRQIYALRGQVVPGNSGGPLIDTSGQILGIVFGHSTTQASTGYALPSTRVATAVQVAEKQGSTVVSTGSCTAH